MIRETEIAIVGAGIAGLAAAYAASSQGASVTILDEQDGPGGWMRASLQEQAGPPEQIDGQRGIELASQAAGWLGRGAIDYQPGSIAWGLFEGRVLGVVGPQGSYQLRAGNVILATGSTEIVWPFRGWTLPGVMTGRAARTYMHLHRVRPGRRAAIIGANSDADRLAEDFALAGVEVVARADLPEQVVAGGDGQVEWVEISGDRVEADTVAIALGSLPDPELARQALAGLVYSERDGCHVPIRSETLETTAEGVYVVGDAGGLCSTAEAVAEGLLAAHAATGSSEVGTYQARLAELRENRAQLLEQPAPDPSQIPDDVYVDREEQVTAARVREAIAEGAITINDVKRRTRAGMGVAQGRDTEYVIARMIHAQTAIPLADLLPMTARPPVRLISLADLADLAERTA